jgi:hypothetical protein
VQSGVALRERERSVALKPLERRPPQHFRGDHNSPATRAQDFIPSLCHLSRANAGSHFGGLYLLPQYAKIVGALNPFFLTILERLCTKAVDND